MATRARRPDKRKRAGRTGPRGFRWDAERFELVERAAAKLNVRPPDLVRLAAEYAAACVLNGDSLPPTLDIQLTAFRRSDAA